MSEHKQPARWQAAIAAYWKAVIAVGGFLLILLNTLGGFFGEWVDTAIAALVAVGVFVKANQGKVEKLTGTDIDEDGVEG